MTTSATTGSARTGSARTDNKRAYRTEEGNRGEGPNGENEDPDTGRRLREMMPKESYSDWAYRNRDMFLSEENSARGPQPIQGDNKEIFWMSFADWARNNPVQLPDTFLHYYHDDTAWIFKVFPIVKTTESKFHRNIIKFPNVLPQIGTRKVPFRNTSFTVESQSKTSIYTGQGFSIDYSHLKTPDGMAEWDAYVAQLTSNMWDAMIYTDMMELLFSPTPYNNPDAIYPNVFEPRTVDDLMRIEQNNFGILNKTPLGIQQLCIQAARILESRGGSLRAFIASATDVVYTNLMDDYKLYYNKAGSSTAKNRDAGSSGYANIANVTVYQVPFLDTHAHDGRQHQLLEHVVGTGSLLQMVDKSVGVDASKYHSGLRSVKWTSHTRNDYDTVQFDTFLSYCFEFHPIVNRDTCTIEEEESTDEATAEEGKLNLELLLNLCSNATMGKHADNPFVKANIRETDENNHKLSTVIAYVGDSDFLTNDSLRWYPINTVGEMHESNLKDAYLDHVIKTMIRAVSAGMSLEDRLSLDDLLQLSEFLDNQQVSKEYRDLALAGDVDEINQFGSVRFYDSADEWGQVPAGFGSINNLLSLENQLLKNELPNLRADIKEKILRCLPVYRKMVSNAHQCSVGHVAFNENMIPYYMRSSDMSAATKRAISFWYSLVSVYKYPVALRKDGGTDPFPFPLHYSGSVGSVEVVHIVPNPEEWTAGEDTANVEGARVIGGVQYLKNKTLSNSIFGALPFLDKRLFPVKGTENRGYRVTPDRAKNANVPGSTALPLYGYHTMAKLKEMIRVDPEEASSSVYFHDFIYYCMAASPFTSSKGPGMPSTLERRYTAAANKSVFEMAISRLVLMQTISVKAMQRWYDCNVAIPLGGAVLRPFEASIMHSQIAMGAERLGSNYFSGFDSTIGFDQFSQQFAVQEFFYHCPFIDNSDRYCVMPFTRGGAKLGGKGNKFINQRDGVGAFYGKNLSAATSSMIDEICAAERLDRFENMGDYTNIAVLQGYNTAVEGMQKRHIDARGGFSADDFAGRLVESDDFLQQTEIHYDGQFVINEVFPFRRTNLRYDPKTMSFSEYATIRQMNFLCSQIDQIYFDETGTEVMMPSSHLWKYQGPGLAEREQSMTIVKTKKQIQAQRAQWLPS